VFEDADKQFDLVFSALKAGRSLAASYNLQADIQCERLISFGVVLDNNIYDYGQCSSISNPIRRLRCLNLNYRPLLRLRRAAKVRRW
jgi:hypothetical protein